MFVNTECAPLGTLLVGETVHAVVETGDRDTPVLVPEARQDLGEFGDRVGDFAAPKTGVQVLVGAVERRFDIGETADAVGDRGAATAEHPGI